MERVGILVVTYGSRGTAILDSLCRSKKYKVETYVTDRNRNPFNLQRAKHHVVIPDLNIKAICKFACKYQNEIDFGIVGPEKPIINGLRNLIERETHIPMICPTTEYAIEKSKVVQRHLFQEIDPDINPRFRVFDPKNYSSINSVRTDVWRWLDELNNQVAVKPDGVASGKGVGIWGDHFWNRKELFKHFLSNYEHGPVIIEEKIIGEESSFQAFCDGRHLIPLPETRDYKRAFDGDKGPNTGGMGSYKAKNDWLPFMTTVDRVKETRAINKIFRKLKGRGSNPGLRGLPFYTAFIHTGKASKILENNSRPGDPEIMNILPILKDDFIDVCFKIINGNLTRINLERKATVATYKVPPTYGGKMKKFSGDKEIKLDAAYRFCREYNEQLRLYPGSLEIREGRVCTLSSRTVAVVGIANDIFSARSLSLEALKRIKGGSLWNRKDIASKEHIKKSIEHMKELRRQ